MCVIVNIMLARMGAGGEVGRRQDQTPPFARLLSTEEMEQGRVSSVLLTVCSSGGSERLCLYEKGNNSDSLTVAPHTR